MLSLPMSLVVVLVLVMPLLIFAIVLGLVLNFAFRNAHHKTMQDGYLGYFKAHTDILNAELQRIGNEHRQQQGNANRETANALRELQSSLEKFTAHAAAFNQSRPHQQGPAFRVGRDSAADRSSNK